MLYVSADSMDCRLHPVTLKGETMKILRINTRTKSFKFEELGDYAAWAAAP